MLDYVGDVMTISGMEVRYGRMGEKDEIGM